MIDDELINEIIICPECKEFGDEQAITLDAAKSLEKKQINIYIFCRTCGWDIKYYLEEEQ